jgi:hypothetical protein
MDPSLRRVAVKSAMSTAAALGLAVDDAVVLHDSNRIAVHLVPCDTLARVAPAASQAGAEFEVSVARRLAQTESPVARLEQRVEPRVYVRDGFAITLWTYHEPVAAGDVPPAEYAQALGRLHAGMRGLGLPAPHFSDRAGEAQALVANHDLTPGLAPADRDLLGNTLARFVRTIGQWGGAEQLLHGEPHPGNLMQTRAGPLFVDLETCCRGPVEFDVAHAPDEVARAYPGLDQDLLGACRILVLAMITTWRWDRRDEFPNGRELAVAWLRQLRAALDR